MSQDRQIAIELIDEAVNAGARRFKACAVLEIDVRTLQRWKRWEKSTGPNTNEGKAVSRMNAYKHGMRSKGVRELESEMALLARLQRALRDYLR